MRVLFHQKTERTYWMNFNKHYDLEGAHAFLSPSNYHWLGYDEEKLIRTYSTFMATKRGSELHELACNCIKLGVKLRENDSTLSMYVNDAIGFKLTPEQPLFYSRNAFGTADAIGFRKGFLRIHDLKTGVTPASMKQLEIYAALFCLEYDVNPKDIDMELRIYQSNEVNIYEPSSNDIFHAMDKIVTFDRCIENLKAEEL